MSCLLYMTFKEVASATSFFPIYDFSLKRPTNESARKSYIPATKVRRLRQADYHQLYADETSLLFTCSLYASMEIETESEESSVVQNP